MPLPTNSMWCLRYKLPRWQELSTQMQSHLHNRGCWGGRGIGLRIFVTDCLQKKSKRGRWFEAGIHQNFFMTIFVFDCMKKCFLIKYKFDQILWEKALKMKVKVIDVSSTKSNRFFLIFRNCQLFHFGQVIEYNKKNIFLQKLCRK